MGERTRGAPRIKKRISCEFDLDGRHHVGVVLDLSATGFFVQTSAKPAPGQTIEISLKIPNRRTPLLVPARVARTKLVPPQLLTVAQGGIGMHVPNPPQSYRELVEEIQKPLRMDPISVLPKDRTSAPASEKKLTREKLDRFFAKPRPSEKRRKKAVAPSRPAPAPTKRPAADGPRFRLLLRDVATSRTRSLVITCASEDEARARVRSELGEGWKVERVTRL